MSDDELPQEVRSLLYDRVDSFEQLDVLVLLHADPRTPWTPRRTASRLGLESSTAAGALEALARRGLLEVEKTSPPSYRFHPVDEATRSAVESLVGLLGARRHVVATLIGSYAMKRVRDSASRAFADAYVLGKRKRDISD